MSHIHQTSTTARSILQSLLFQLAFDVKDAQSVLVESNERELLGSTRYVLELLKTLLDTPTVGPTYIVLDGLDEMEAAERGILLQQLTDLEGCSGVKILISSRREDDIAGILDAKATEIRVDKRNSASIQTYVNQRTADWMRTVDLDQESRKQVERLLAPVTENANGKYLTDLKLVDQIRVKFANHEILTQACFFMLASSWTTPKRATALRKLNENSEYSPST